MANVNQVSPDGGTTLYDIEDTPIRSSIARTEDGTSPSATINADEEFYHLNVLYKATQDIATTDTITPNSNCEVSPSVTSQIAQKADISSLGTASAKNSTSVVTDSEDVVESGAVFNAIKGSVGFVTTGKNKNSGDANHVFIRGTARTFYFPLSIPIVSGHKYKFVADVSAISGYTGTDALGFRIAVGGDISGTYAIKTNAQGQQVTEMTATGSADSGAYVYCFIPNTEGNNATITLSNVMVVEESVTDYSYEPYHKSVEQTLRDAEVIEGKNLISGALVSSVSANISVSVNANNSVLFTGKANGTTRTPTISENFTLKAGTYILNGCTGGSNNTYGLRVGLASTGNEIAICYDGDVSFTLNADTEVKMIGRFSVNYTDTYNVTMYPMIRKATETDPTYEPYYVPLKDVVPNKCDNSVIGTVEDGTTASQAYAVGSHAIRNGAFITWKNAKAQGETINDASDYTSGDVADFLAPYTTLASGDFLEVDTEINLADDFNNYRFVTILSGTNNNTSGYLATLQAALVVGGFRMVPIGINGFLTIEVISNTKFKIVNKNTSENHGIRKIYGYK